MSQFLPQNRRPLSLAARRPATNASSSHSYTRLLSASVSAVALLLALTGDASAQQATTPQDAVPAQAAPNAPTANAQPQQGGQIMMRPVEVTAVKPKKPAKKKTATPAPAVANTAGQSGSDNGTALPVKVQAKTELGRLTPATPVTGSVIPREQLEEVRAADMQRELLPLVPGVSMVRNMRIPIGGKGYTNDLIDGFSMKSASLGNVGFLDEVNTTDIESIEITRGPGSVLYSSKAVGGTINVITRDPPLTPEYGVWGDAGTYGLRRVGAHAAGSSENGAVGVSVNANYMQDEGWRDHSERDKQSISGKFVMKPDADTKVTFRAEYVDLYREYPGSISETQFNQDWRQAQYLNLYEDMRYYTTMVDVKRRVGQGGELTFAWVNHKTWGTNACPAGCSSRAASTTQGELDYEDNNLRAVYRQDFDLLKSRVYVGIDAFLSEKGDDSYSRKDFVRGALNKSFSIEETTLAPFAQYEFSPLERLRFTMGVRQENYALDIDDRMATNKDGSKEYDKLVRKGGVTYEYVNNHYVWGGIAEGFYVPSTDQTVSGANAKDLPPETSVTYSAGIRGTLPTQRITYDFGVYRSVIDNMAVSMPCNGDTTLCPDGAGTGATYPAAAGQSEFEGIESTVSWRPIDLFKLSATHTYALNSFIDFKDSTGDYSGKTYSWSPDHHLNGRITVYPVKGLSVQLEADYISRYYTNTLNNDSYQRPVLYNLRVGYKTEGGLEYWAHAYNLFDTKYAERVSATNVASPSRTYSEGYHPLTVRAGISYKW